jgi:hypothetical protein
VVRVLLDISGLAAGSYTGTITISGSVATNTPQKVMVSLVLYPSNSWRRVIRVPGDTNYLQEGIDRAAAWPGSTVLVGPGQYQGPIRLQPGIRVIGENPESTIIIARSELEPAVVGANNTVISGFTIQGGQVGIDLGLNASPASTEIFNNRITQSEIAIAVGSGASPVISNNIIGDVQKAIYVNGGSPVVRNNVIFKVAPSDAITLWGHSSAAIVNNVFDSIGDPSQGQVRR